MEPNVIQSSPTEVAVPQPQPAPAIGVAVDIVILTVVDGRLRVLLSLRPTEPFKGYWSLPGGFVGQNESSDTAAERELQAKTGVGGIYLEQLYTFSEPLRDPRSRVIAVAYYALVSADRLPNQAGSRESRWFDVSAILDDPPPAGNPAEDIQLGFDHELILRTARDRIRGKLEYVPIGFQLLPERFTLTELQHVYEAILGHGIDKRNFRTKVLRSGLVRESDEYRKGKHRPARLYEFKQRTF